MACLGFSSFVLLASLVARTAHCTLRAFFTICSRIFNLENSLGLLFNI